MRLSIAFIALLAGSNVLWGTQTRPVSLRPETVQALNRIDAITQRIQFLERRQRYTVLRASERAAINSELARLRHNKVAEEARLKRAGEDPALWALHPNKDDLALAQISVGSSLVPVSPAMPGSPAIDEASPWTLPSETQRTSAADASVDRAQTAVDNTAAKADNAAQKANDQTTKAADKAAAKADQAATKAQDNVDKAAAKADQAAAKAQDSADKAAAKADKAAEKADKSAGKTK
jgi:hypothetical protein